MQLIRSIDAYYPMFNMGSEPRAVLCQLSIVEVNGKRYLRTPFAFLDAFADDDCERQIGKGYYATEAECVAYLEAEYPAWRRAQPIMKALLNAIHHHGTICGPSRVADMIDCPTDAVYRIARGHKRFPRISAFVKRLAMAKAATR